MASAFDCRNFIAIVKIIVNSMPSIEMHLNFDLKEIVRRHSTVSRFEMRLLCANKNNKIDAYLKFIKYANAYSSGGTYKPEYRFNPIGVWCTSGHLGLAIGRSRTHVYICNSHGEGGVDGPSTVTY